MVARSPLQTNEQIDAREPQNNRAFAALININSPPGYLGRSHAMAVQYAKTFVDRACDSRDVFTLYDIVRTLDTERNFPEQFKLLVRMWEWCCSTRSGVWQYYENIPLAEFQETAEMMDRCDLGKIAERFRGGMENWEEPQYCGDLDAWIDGNWDVFEDAAMALVETDRKFLYPITK